MNVFGFSTITFLATVITRSFFSGMSTSNLSSSFGSRAISNLWLFSCSSDPEAYYTEIEYYTTTNTSWVRNSLK